MAARDGKSLSTSGFLTTFGVMELEDELAQGSKVVVKKVS
jgi:hypothetical protein